MHRRRVEAGQGEGLRRLPDEAQAAHRETRRRILNAYPADYYEKRLQDDGTPWLMEVGCGPYAELHREAARLVLPGHDVVELGCGTGRFAQMLFEGGWINSYLGIDFADALLEEARRFTGRPEAFMWGDLIEGWIPPADTYVAMEVLEHLDDDLGLIERLPSGSRLVLSVPSFDSESHLRRFPRMNEAVGRYKNLLSIDTVKHLDVPGGRGNYFHLLRGTRR